MATSKKHMKLSEIILKNYEVNYGDEVHQILNTRPDWFTRIGTSLIILFALFVILSTALLKYPQTSSTSGNLINIRESSHNSATNYSNFTGDFLPEKNDTTMLHTNNATVAKLIFKNWQNHKNLRHWLKLTIYPNKLGVMNKVQFQIASHIFIRQRDSIPVIIEVINYDKSILQRIVTGIGKL